MTDRQGNINPYPAGASHYLSGAPGACIVIAVLGVALAGCGYTHQPLYAEDVNTVAVPIFENKSIYQDIERDVTEALINEIELRTPYKVVARDRAETLLEGTITQVDQGRLSRRHEGGLPQELEMRVRVSFTWKDLRSGQTLRERRGLVAAGRYIPAVEVGEQYQTAQHAAAQRLAFQIVATMGERW